MIRRKLLFFAILTIAAGFIFSTWVPLASAQQSAPTYLNRNQPFPDVELPVPENEADRKYLGLANKEGTFKIGQIEPPIVLIEVLSIYCPYCQRSQPQVNELYKQIQGRPDLKNKIRMIGVGIGNTPYELNMYKEKYDVPFPLISDPDSQVAKELKIPGTPTFVGVRVDGKGAQQEFFFKPGAFKDQTQFLNDLLKASGLQ